MSQANKGSPVQGSPPDTTENSDHEQYGTSPIEPLPAGSRREAIANWIKEHRKLLAGVAVLFIGLLGLRACSNTNPEPPPTVLEVPPTVSVPTRIAKTLAPPTHVETPAPTPLATATQLPIPDATVQSDLPIDYTLLMDLITLASGQYPNGIAKVRLRALNDTLDLGLNETELVDAAQAAGGFVLAANGVDTNGDGTPDGISGADARRLNIGQQLSMPTDAALVVIARHIDKDPTQFADKKEQDFTSAINAAARQDFSFAAQQINADLNTLMLDQFQFIWDSVTATR